MAEPWNILKEYRVTEKASNLSAVGNCYTFEVVADANRTAVADAVEAAFKVKVKKVNILVRKPKIKRSRMRKSLPGAVGGMKKALVFLKKGYHIEVI
jgi:large subunit ribosomal protein L23